MRVRMLTRSALKSKSVRCQLMRVGGLGLAEAEQRSTPSTPADTMVVFEMEVSSGLSVEGELECQDNGE